MKSLFGKINLSSSQITWKENCLKKSSFLCLQCFKLSESHNKIILLNFQYFWCDRRSTQVVTNPVLSFFSFLETINEIQFSRSILNRFWSTKSQILDNAVLHHIIMRTLWFFMKIQKIWANRSLGLRFLGKHQPQANKFWSAVKPFSIIYLSNFTCRF